MHELPFRKENDAAVSRRSVNVQCVRTQRYAQWTRIKIIGTTLFSYLFFLVINIGIIIMRKISQINIVYYIKNILKRIVLFLFLRLRIILLLDFIIFF